MKTPINRVIKILITSDIVVLSAFGFINPIFAIFVTGQIEGGGIRVVGIAAALYWVFKSLIQIPIGMRLDKVHGEKDDFFSLLLGTILVSLVPFGYIFSRLPLHIYGLQILYAIGYGLAIPSWGGFFTRNIDKGKEAFEWSLESTSVGLGAGISAALGGILADKFGFSLVFLIVGILSLIGATILLLLYSHLNPQAVDSRGEVAKIKKPWDSSSSVGM